MTVRRYIFDVDYDSMLGYPNEYNVTTFKLVLRVFLQPFNPPDAPTQQVGVPSDPKPVCVQRWTDAEWATYKDDLKSDAEKYLNYPVNPLALRPQARRNDKMSSIQYLYFVHQKQRPDPAAVLCGVTILLVDNEALAHVKFQVVRVTDGQDSMRSGVVQLPGDQDFGFLSNRDIDRWSPDAQRQNAVSHELGHVLGLGHSNANDPECKKGGDDDARICYGKPGSPEWNNLMGAGNQVTEANAAPWMNRIRDHAFGLDWSPTKMFTLMAPRDSCIDDYSERCMR